MLASWMRDNRSTKWSIGCKFVQLKKKHSLHTSHKCSPYKATFGIDTPLGLQSTVIPVEAWTRLKSPKELFEAVGQTFDGVDLEEELDVDEPPDIFSMSR